MADREHDARLRRHERPTVEVDRAASAYVAQDGIALAVRPAHTHWDGDTVFTFGTGAVEPDWLRLPEMTTEVVAEAIRRGVRAVE